MNGSSNAMVLTESAKPIKMDIVKVNCAHKRNMFKQRVCGVIFLSAVLTASLIIGDIETLFFMIPAACYLIFTKTSILTFECE